MCGRFAQSQTREEYLAYLAEEQYSDGSGCGNETASEKPLMRQFMLESVKYWKIGRAHV